MNDGMSVSSGRAESTKKRPFNNGKAEGNVNPVSSKKTGAIAELPVLRWGQGTNYTEFKKELSTYAVRVYKDLGRLIEDVEYYEPPAVDYSEEELANDHIERFDQRSENKKK